MLSISAGWGLPPAMPTRPHIGLGPERTLQVPEIEEHCATRRVTGKVAAAMEADVIGNDQRVRLSTNGRLDQTHGFRVTWPHRIAFIRAANAEGISRDIRIAAPELRFTHADVVLMPETSQRELGAALRVYERTICLVDIVEVVERLDRGTMQVRMHHRFDVVVGRAGVSQLIYVERSVRDRLHADVRDSPDDRQEQRIRSEVALHRR